MMNMKQSPEDTMFNMLDEFQKTTGAVDKDIYVISLQGFKGLGVDIDYSWIYMGIYFDRSNRYQSKSWVRTEGNVSLIMYSFDSVIENIKEKSSPASMQILFPRESYIIVRSPIFDKVIENKDVYMGLFFTKNFTIAMLGEIYERLRIAQYLITRPENKTAPVYSKLPEILIPAIFASSFLSTSVEKLEVTFEIGPHARAVVKRLERLINITDNEALKPIDIKVCQIVCEGIAKLYQDII